MSRAFRAALGLAAAALLLPVPALADITARYQAGKDVITVEVDDGGDYRISYAGKAAVIHHAGGDYFVLEFGPEPVTVERTATFAAVAKLLAADTKRGKVPDAEFVLSRGADATVGGRAGTSWLLKPDLPEEKPLELVMSSDPALAPIGAAIRDTMVPFGDLFGTGMAMRPSFAQQWAALFAKGTPLQLGVEKPEIVLASIDTKDIPATRFALPSAVVPPDTLAGMLMGARGSQAEMVEPEVPAPLP